MTENKDLVENMSKVYHQSPDLSARPALVNKASRCPESSSNDEFSGYPLVGYYI
jgi:hypothetical protein